MGNAFFNFKQKTSIESVIRAWSSDVCSSDLARWVDRLLPTASCHAIEASWHDSADPARIASNYDHVRNESTGLLRATCQREAASDGVNCRDHAARRAGKESRHAARICCHLPRLYASRRWRKHFRARAPRHDHQLLPGVAQTLGEPMARLSSRDRPYLQPRTGRSCWLPSVGTDAWEL